MQQIRRPAVSDSFYPGEKESLTREINSFLEKEDSLESIKRPRILILPHAGYDFSGPVAAAGFKTLEGEKFQNIFILGSSHSEFFSGACISPDHFQTPLGIAKTKLELAEKLAEQNPDLIRISSEAHRADHNLEVQIPFLQTVLSQQGFNIVAILLGSMDTESEEALVKALEENIGEDDLLLVSSDLSHYPDIETAEECDRQTIEGILSGDPCIFQEKIKENRQAFPTVDTFACGEKAISIALSLAKRKNISDFRLIKYENSGHRPLGSRDRVVGYAALAAFA